jgi:hypothetical protein
MPSASAKIPWDNDGKAGLVRCSRRQLHRKEATDAPHQPDHHAECVSPAMG